MKIAPKNWSISPLDFDPYENFAPHRMFRGDRPLANGEESVQISAPSAEIWGAK